MSRSGLSSARRRALCLVGLALAFWLGAAGAAIAQEESASSVELWPEMDVWWRLDPAWRLSMFVPISKNVESEYREGSLILQADYGWGRSKRLFNVRLADEDRAREMKVFLARVGYLYGQSLGDEGAAYREDMVFCELHLRNPLKGRILISHRLRTDFRWLNEENDFSARLRYRLMVEKEYLSGRMSIVPYMNVEPYYDSRYQTVNRVRVIGGATVSWTPRIALEGNVTYQYDTKASVTNLYALNVILHVFL